jgi:hypothetical protein
MSFTCLSCDGRQRKPQSACPHFVLSLPCKALHRSQLEMYGSEAHVWVWPEAYTWVFEYAPQTSMSDAPIRDHVKSAQWKEQPHTADAFLRFWMWLSAGISSSSTHRLLRRNRLVGLESVDLTADSLPTLMPFVDMVEVRIVRKVIRAGSRSKLCMIDLRK